MASQSELWSDFARTRGYLGAPYQAHSQTSREAALSIVSELGTLQAEVLAYIRLNGPVTDAEVISGLGRGANSIRPRRIELLKAGLIRPWGKVMQPNGRRAQLWKAI